MFSLKAFAKEKTMLPDQHGHFGEFGGRYVSETLMALLEDLEGVFKSLKKVIKL